MLSRAKYKTEIEYSSSWVEAPSSSGDRYLSRSWLIMNVKPLELICTRMRKLAPFAEAERTEDMLARKSGSVDNRL